MIVRVLAAAFSAFAATSAVAQSYPREPLAADGAEPGALTQREFAAFLQADAVRWARVVKQSGAKAE